MRGDNQIAFWTGIEIEIKIGQVLGSGGVSGSGSGNGGGGGGGGGGGCVVPSAAPPAIATTRPRDRRSSRPLTAQETKRKS